MSAFQGRHWSGKPAAPVLHAENLILRELTCYIFPMAKYDYYLGRFTVTAPLRDGLEEPALSLSKGPALESVSHVSFLAHSALRS